MQTISQADMMEATRLTREGRLQEAMALLQGGGALPSSPDGRGTVPDAPAKGGAARPMAPMIDMEPPSARTGGAWSAPRAAARPAGINPAGRPSGEVPPALKGLMDRMAGLGANGGLMSGLPGQSGLAAANAAVSVPPGASFEERVFANAAGSRPYKLYVPAVFSGDPLPLVVMLHGCTQSPDDFAAGTRMNELAEEFGFFVVYPGQTQAANMSRCWNWFNAADQQRDQGEPSLIAGMTRTIMGEFPVDKERVYIAGLSAGGAKAAIMGATYPDLYAAVGVHSGLACGAARDMGSAFAAMKQGGAVAGTRSGLAKAGIPSIVFHGDRDTTVHPVNGDQVVTQAAAGAAHRTEVAQGKSSGGMAFTQTTHRDGSGQAVLEQWVLHGAGHAWSGGSAVGSYTDPRGPDASREMARFFMEHRVPAATVG
ncbi:PHB depolymerase family esterase [Rubellimicrobium rubrum]|uniref:PHB depolymerase family esterase n=1 Tax=Rubellimicrobium rubrum TaxID=2585369 RepID=A0A5C4MUS6_9RHOB|nr:PHB depolymerase family esterase [Rubellimicrobium rubrum]TNC49130.1 PHB depolymerase family esterase [Rubellimicrobium rubrum]